MKKYTFLFSIYLFISVMLLFHSAATNNGYTALAAFVITVGSLAYFLVRAAMFQERYVVEHAAIIHKDAVSFIMYIYDTPAKDIRVLTKEGIIRMDDSFLRKAEQCEKVWDNNSKLLTVMSWLLYEEDKNKPKI